MIILDFSGGNTHKNSANYLQRMVDELKAVDTGKHEIVIKHQLFQEAGDNIPLDRDMFTFAYNYAAKVGYKTTASVFDISSLKFLLKYNIPFVKLANRPDLYWLAGEVPRKIPVYMSVEYEGGDEYSGIQPMACVSEYPATIADYEESFIFPTLLYNAISDHTTDFTLYHKYKPVIYECHYRLADSTGPDAGPFAKTPDQLREIL